MRPTVSQMLTVFVFVVTGLATTSASAQYRSRYPYHYHPRHGYVPAVGATVNGYGSANPGAGYNVGAASEGIGQGQMYHQQAMQQYIENQSLAEKTRIENSQAREQATQDRENRERAKDQRLREAAQRSVEQMAAPHRLTADQFDHTRNVLHWPYVLRDSSYSDIRYKIDQLFHERTPDDSGPESDNYHEVKEATEQLLDLVMKEVRAGKAESTDWITAKHFLDSVAYEAKFKVKN